MPPPEIFAGLTKDDALKAIQEYKKFDKKWNIVKLLGYLFIGVSFIFSGGVGFQKSMDWKWGVDNFKTEMYKRVENLEKFTGCPKVYLDHKQREEYLNSIKVKSNEDN